MKQCVACLLFVVSVAMSAQGFGRDSCERPQPGSVVAEPASLSSKAGVLTVDFTIHNVETATHAVKYCYLDASGHDAPTLRLNPGDLLILRLKNDIQAKDVEPVHHHQAPPNQTTSNQTAPNDKVCSAGSMTVTSTNLHFHGLTVPAVCHQDDVMQTVIGAGAPVFEYRFKIPDDQPPGLYWYHPHIHGFTKAQVLGGASGAMIIEGLERANQAVAGLPERVFIIRDQELLNPDAPPSKSEPVVPKMLIDRDGDSANNGTGFGKPAKDLSINFVPVPYPDYPVAQINMRPAEKQLWRVLNASAITYLNLAVVFNRTPQKLGLVALDGVPLNIAGGYREAQVDWETHLGVPPGSRVEFIVEGPPAGVPALFVTRTVDTGPGGENDPNRALASIHVSEDAAEPKRLFNRAPIAMASPTLPWLGNATPIRTRKLYFSEKLLDPSSPTSATEFYVTVDGGTPKVFDPTSGIPDIVAQQGTVEDWIIENRSNELHAFHIHQLHFMLLDYLGQPVDEPFLRDTVNVPYLKKQAMTYPSVRIRMDFRDPNAVGTYPFHCHLLEHEDNGMMGVIRVEPALHENGATR